MLAMLQDFVAVQDVNPPVEAPPPAPVANAVVQMDVQLEMLRILQEMHQAYAQGGRGIAGRGGQGGRGRQGGQGGFGGRRYGNRNRNCRTPDNANFVCRVTNQYCHTHGGYNHISGDCTRKASGHNDAATFDNRCGGSNAFFQPIAGE